MRNAFPAVCLLFCASVAQSSVLTFDDISTAPILDDIGEGYGGLEWTNGAGPIRLINKNFRPGTGYEIGAVSGDYVAFNSGANTPSFIDVIGDTKSMRFQGVYMTSAWVNQSVYFIGYSDGVQLVQSSLYDLTPTSPSWIELNWSGIDRLSIHASGQDDGHWVMDNFSYSVVPIPAAVWLFGSALAGLGWLRRKQTV
jgi:hypothetical protein